MIKEVAGFEGFSDFFADSLMQLGEPAEYTDPNISFYSSRKF